MADHLVKDDQTFNPAAGVPLALLGVVIFFVLARVLKFLNWGM